MSLVQDKFKQFDAANPQVYDLFKQFAFALINAGSTKISSNLIINRIRWECTIKTTGSKYLIDNRFSAWYARKFVADFPQYSDMIDLRAIRTP